MNQEALADTVRELSTRPGHEKVRALLHRLLTDALGASSEQISFEHRMPEVRGRADALVGRTVIEVKRDLKAETTDAETQLARYLPQREAETGQRYVGLATDGATFRAYEMRDGALVKLNEHQARPQQPLATPLWLENVVAIRDSLPADAPTLIAMLGRQSTAYARAGGLLRRAWDRLKARPEPLLKRQLWEQHLALVYGKAIDSDELWVQHSYLVVVAKAIAVAALTRADVTPRDLLSGRPFADAGIVGAVESDFFDWVLDDPEGEATIRLIVAHARRFDLSRIDVDLLKLLYESLIDPDNRHDLGEYYTPDWLAARVTRRALAAPLTDRVLDPSCGSGTFLFHAVRQKRAALEAAGIAADETAERCVATVHGLDVHPVAVIIARVTVLLALGDALLNRRGPIAVPVFLGNAMQWDVRRDEHDLVVEVPPAPGDGTLGGKTLRFPLPTCADQGRLDAVVAALHEASEAGEDEAAFENRLEVMDVAEADRRTLRTTYGLYHDLRRAGRDHIWGYVARNLSRPVALSDGKPMDVIVGNPPWLSYRFMSRALQKRFKDASQDLRVWVGKEEAKLVTQTDLSGYFFANSVRLYLKPGGRIAMVLPLAAMTRGQFAAFRSGDWAGVKAAFTDAWVLDNQAIEPLFRVPTCVLFAERAAAPRSLPGKVLAFAGHPPRKDATEAEVEGRVRTVLTDAPGVVSYDHSSRYGDRFRQGASLVPRMLCYVRRAPIGKLGSNAAAPQVVSARSPQEKKPWKDLPPLAGPVDAASLRTAYLGASIAPFRVLDAPEAVVPVLDDGEVLDAAAARARGQRHTAKWLAECEALWARHGSGNLSFEEQINYNNKLEAQFPVAKLRVAYAASGTVPAACIIRDERGVIEHAMYWFATEKEDEAHYLCALLNSESVRRRIVHMQSRGEQGARHFDKLAFTLPIPDYDAGAPLHRRLADAGRRAEAVAAAVPLAADVAFTAARKAIRAHLTASGVAAEIDALVDALLDDAPAASSGFKPPRISAEQREAMLQHARAAQARLADDPAEARRIAYVMEVAAENAIGE